VDAPAVRMAPDRPVKRGDALNGAFPQVDVLGLYKLHCESCECHALAATDHVAARDHTSCYIHRLLSCLDGVPIMFQPGREPTQQLRARPIRLTPGSAEWLAADAEMQKLDALQLLEYVDGDDPNLARIISSSFVVPKGKLRQSADEAAYAGPSVTEVDVPRINDLAQRRASAFVARLKLAFGNRGGASEAEIFAKVWSEELVDESFRLVIGYHTHLNERCEAWPMRLPTASMLVADAHPDDLAHVCDLKAGFHALPLQEEARKFAAFYHPTRTDSDGNPLVCRPRRVGFGWTLAPGVYCAFTGELNRAVLFWIDRHAGGGTSIYYVDDNGARVNANHLPGLKNELQRIFTAVNVLESPAKEREGQSVEFLGRRADVASRSLAVSPPSIHRALVMLHIAINLIDAARDPASPKGIDTVYHRWLDKLAGNVQWLAENSYEGRLYTRALWHAVDEAKAFPSGPQLSHRSGLYSACQWWVDKAASNTLRPHSFVPLSSIPRLTMARITPSSAVLQTDGTPFPVAFLPSATSGASDGRVLATSSDAAGDAGWAIIWNGKSLTGRWAQHQQAWGIAAKELWPILVLLRLMGPSLKGYFVAFGTDNAGNALVIDGGNPAAETARLLIRELYSCADACGFHFVAWWLPRSCNVVCDLLSKCRSRDDACRIAEAYGLELLDEKGPRPVTL
jgi:uncharacterized protein YbdZ (MbtH family)